MATDLDERTATSQPTMPPEVWALWSDIHGWIQGQEHEGDPKLWYESEEDADIAAAHHAAEYAVICRPVNLLKLKRR